MDGDEVSNATMCLTTLCTTCWCPKDQMSDTNAAFLRHMQNNSGIFMIDQIGKALTGDRDFSNSCEFGVRYPTLKAMMNREDLHLVRQ